MGGRFFLLDFEDDECTLDNQDTCKFLNSLLKGIKNIFILWIISQNKIHGYGIISKLNEALSSVSDQKVVYGSNIYPILHSLENDALIKSSEQLHGKNKVKMYEITEKGILFLNSLKYFIQSNPEHAFFMSFMDDLFFNDMEFTLDKEGG